MPIPAIPAITGMPQAGANGMMAAILAALQKAGVNFGVQGRNFSAGVDFGAANRRQRLEDLLARLVGVPSTPGTPAQPTSMPVRTLGTTGGGGMQDMPPSFEALLRRRPSRGLVPMR